MTEKKRKKAEYELFLKNITVFLDKLRRITNITKLKFDLDEINLVQSLYTKNYINPELISCTIEELDDIFCAYMGTAWMWYLGGNWSMNQKKDSVSYGKAIIKEYGGENYPSIPLIPYNWVYFIKTNQFENEMIGDIFAKKIEFHNNHPEYEINPKRDIL